jgi:hypothetical protein
MPSSKGAERTFGQLRVEVFDTAAELGRASAQNTAQVIRERVSQQGTARADFQDPKWVRRIELDDRSRKQQVGEGHFATVDDVPRFAISLTVPALVAPQAVQATVPEHRKASAVRAALIGPVSPACPASVLREHPNAVLFLDGESSSLLESSSRESED